MLYLQAALFTYCHSDCSYLRYKTNPNPPPIGTVRFGLLSNGTPGGNRILHCSVVAMATTGCYRFSSGKNKKTRAGRSRCRVLEWYSRRESNPQRSLRRGLLYPFNYGSVNILNCQRRYSAKTVGIAEIYSLAKLYC